MTVVAARYGGWYARLVRQPGKETREGSDVARMVVGVRHNNCPVIVDVGGGWGAAAVGALERNGIPVVAFNGVNPSAVTSREGNLKFHNKRAEGWWRLREELNPDQQFGSTIALPPGAAIKADLAAPRWELTPRGIKVEDKNEIRKRLGRSPDDGDAIVMCLAEGAKAAMRQLRAQHRERRPERAEVGYADFKRRFCGSPAERPGGARHPITLESFYLRRQPLWRALIGPRLLGRARIALQQPSDMDSN
jgi:hypothetical protein